MKALKALVGMHEVYEEVIKAHRPAEDQENIEHIQSFIERENNILRESQRKEKELRKKLKDNEKVVIDLRKQLQEQSSKTCVVCLSADANMVFVPCGHVCTCRECSKRLQNNCPICRRRFTSLVRVYTP